MESSDASVEKIINSFSKELREKVLWYLLSLKNRNEIYPLIRKIEMQYYGYKVLSDYYSLVGFSSCNLFNELFARQLPQFYEEMAKYKHYFNVDVIYIDNLLTDDNNLKLKTDCILLNDKYEESPHALKIHKAITNKNEEQKKLHHICVCRAITNNLSLNCNCRPFPIDVLIHVSPSNTDWNDLDDGYHKKAIDIIYSTILKLKICKYSGNIEDYEYTDMELDINVDNKNISIMYRDFHNIQDHSHE